MDNTLGFIATLTYVATLLPSNLKVAFPAFRYTAFSRILQKNRREIGIWTFVLSVLHACFVLYHHDPDISKVEFYRKSISGLSLMFIFALLAVTSNNWSIRKLRKNWKRLHSLTYVALFMLPWHIIHKMGYQWSAVTSISMTLVINIICIWVFRKYQEEQRQKSI
ncbi:Ferric reductase like transmembrane component superfamily [Synechococcus sp. PCC 7335]|uniref:ferric reductase-like transmembrane domain-containing protein n=1 Tax=Synechococcus sp. (strain ATCC 29403 / PCC 7335) TaxID=91464 RepID=UPI00017ED9CB|nr:Ferric reductase like transmembrane component superfamily [Synechococcus sp. PCC 7335]